MQLPTKLHLLPIISLFVVNYEAMGKSQEPKCGKCGRRVPALEGIRGPKRIIDGKEVKPNFKYPWVVKILAARNCTGSIISKRYIMTSAFCLTTLKSDKDQDCQNNLPRKCYVSKSTVKVRVPWKDTSKFRTTYSADAIIPHPEYDHQCKKNDIALIRVNKDIECNSFKQPICLPKSDRNKFGGRLVIAGWGEITPEGITGSNVLREGEMEQARFDACKDFQKCFRGNSSIAICVAGTNKRQTPCKGDSGSPTFTDFNKAYYALGITSLPRSKSCQPSKAITFTKIYAYIDWIKKYVKRLPEPYRNFIRVDDLEIDNEPFEE